MAAKDGLDKLRAGAAAAGYVGRLVGLGALGLGRLMLGKIAPGLAEKAALRRRLAEEAGARALAAMDADDANELGRLLDSDPKPHLRLEGFMERREWMDEAGARGAVECGKLLRARGCGWGDAFSSSCALGRAARAGEERFVEWAVSEGAKVAAPRSGDMTPIEIAAMGGHKSMFESMLARVDGLDAKGRAVILGMAAAHQGIGIVEELLERPEWLAAAAADARPGKGVPSLLMLAADKSIKAVELLLPVSDLSWRLPPNEPRFGEGGSTALICAVGALPDPGPLLAIARARGRLDGADPELAELAREVAGRADGATIAALAELGLDLGQRCSSEFADRGMVSGDHWFLPIHEACRRGNHLGLSAIVARIGAEAVDAVDSDGLTALEVCAQGQVAADREAFGRCAELLLSAGADPLRGFVADGGLGSPMDWSSSRPDRCALALAWTEEQAPALAAILAKVGVEPLDRLCAPARPEHLLDAMASGPTRAAIERAVARAREIQELSASVGEGWAPVPGAPKRRL